MLADKPDGICRRGDEHRPKNEDDGARLALQRDLERELGLRQEWVVELMNCARVVDDKGRVCLRLKQTI